MKDGPCQSLGEVRCEFDERKKFAEICESHDEIGHWVSSAIALPVSSIYLTLERDLE